MIGAPVSHLIDDRAPVCVCGAATVLLKGCAEVLILEQDLGCLSRLLPIWQAVASGF